MVVNTLMYVMLVIAGLIGGAVAWDDLAKSAKPKNDPKAESTAK